MPARRLQYPWAARPWRRLKCAVRRRIVKTLLRDRRVHHGRRRYRHDRASHVDLDRATFRHSRRVVRNRSSENGVRRVSSQWQKPRERRKCSALSRSFHFSPGSAPLRRPFCGMSALALLLIGGHSSDPASYVSPSFHWWCSEASLHMRARRVGAPPGTRERAVNSR